MFQEDFLIDMKRTGVTTWYSLATLALASLIWAAPAGAQMQNSATPQDRDDLTRQQLAGFDQFLDSHPDLAAQIQKDPSLVNNDDFVKNHPDLQQYLQQHPEVRADISQNPNAVMHQEQRYERTEDANSDRNRDRDHDRDNDVTRRDLTLMNDFLESHPEIAEQVRKDPSLLDNKNFVNSHPALQQFMATHSQISEEIRENPNGFMRDEHRYDRREDQRYASIMDSFMDHHPEIAQQLQKNPSLVNDKQFVANHPAFQQFLSQHPELAQDYKDNPNAFMRQEDRYEHHEETASGRNSDVTRGELASFHQFLQGHNGISNELSKNPELAKNQEYLENHSELQTYLKANPQVREELNENPQSFVQSAQGVDANSMVKGTVKTPAEPKK